MKIFQVTKEETYTAAQMKKTAWNPPSPLAIDPAGTECLAAALRFCERAAGCCQQAAGCRLAINQNTGKSVPAAS